MGNNLTFEEMVRLEEEKYGSKVTIIEEPVITFNEIPDYEKNRLINDLYYKDLKVTSFDEPTNSLTFEEMIEQQKKKDLNNHLKNSLPNPTTFDIHSGYTIQTTQQNIGGFNINIQISSDMKF